MEVLDVQAWWKHGEFVEQGQNVWSVELNMNTNVNIIDVLLLTWRGIFND